MSDYDEHYMVHYNRNYVRYTSDPSEALALITCFPQNAYVCDGYADYQDMPDGRTMVTRRTIGPVLASTLEFLVARTEALALLSRLTGQPVTLARQR